MGSRSGPEAAPAERAPGIDQRLNVTFQEARVIVYAAERPEWVTNGSWYTVRRDVVELPDGTVTDFYVSVRPHVALVLAVTDEEQVVLVQQYKHGAGGITLELPAGTFTAPEEPARAAARELLEETGYVCAALEPTGVWWNDSTKNTHRVHTFLGRSAAPSGSRLLDDTEDIDVILAPVAELAAMVDEGTICSMSSVAAVYRSLRAI